LRAAAWGLIGLTGLLCGAAGGFYLGTESSNAASMASRIRAVSDASDAVAKTHAAATSLDYEAALWHFLAVLQSESVNRPPILDDWTIATDTALTYARLANLAMEQGLADRARVLLSKATDQCSRMRLKDCNADVILQMAKTPLPAAR
jgi:hypothetical protein